MKIVINDISEIKELWPTNKENLEVALKLIASYCVDMDKQYNATNIEFKVKGIHEIKTGKNLGSMELVYKRGK